jgi:hypothetical protein
VSEDDILSQGGDREPGPWPRRLAMITALIVAVAGGAIYLSIPRHQHAPVTARQAPVTHQALVTARLTSAATNAQSLPYENSLIPRIAVARATATAQERFLPNDSNCVIAAMTRRGRLRP